MRSERTAETLAIHRQGAEFFLGNFRGEKARHPLSEHRFERFGIEGHEQISEGMLFRRTSRKP
jgi:hypothetical protein